MKLPGKVRSMIDEMGLSSKDKTAVLRHLNDMADSLPEHPTPAEAKRIVDGALKKVGAGKKKDEEKPEEKEEKKEDKPKEEKKEKVEESRKMTFKTFLESKSAVYKDAIVSAAKKIMGTEDDSTYADELANALQNGVAYDRASIAKVLKKLGQEHFADDLCDALALA